MENENLDLKALFKIEYGLYVLTSNDGNKDNGMILNSVMQLTSSPNVTLAVSLNKANYSTETILKTKKFNISVLSEDVKFDIFTRFGFKSGRDSNKFEDFKDYRRSKNGLAYLDKYSNAFMSLEVVSYSDVGSHILFICKLVESKVLTPNKSVTYSYYHSNIKPKPVTSAPSKKRRWICTICNYIYEGDELPEDFVCPICGHGREYFKELID